MAKEKKRKQPASDSTAPPGDEGEGRRERKGKKAKKDKAEAILPSQIKNKDKRSELHAKLKREKKSEKRKLSRERSQAIRRAEELGEQASKRSSNCSLSPVEFGVFVGPDCLGCLQPPERQVPRTIENTREPDETVCRPDDQEVRI
jgi:ribosome production factor 1